MKINVVGLGQSPSDMSLAGYEKVKEGGHIYARSERLVALARLKAEGVVFSSFDYIYESSEDFDELNDKIAKTLIKECEKFSEITYLVDGSGAFDKTLSLLDENIIEVFPSISKGAKVHARLGGGKGLTEISAYDFVKLENFGGDLAECIYIFDVDSDYFAREVKLKLMKILDDEQEIVLVKGKLEKKMPLFELDRESEFDENSGVYFIFLPFEKKKVFSFLDLLDIIAKLRSENGCPWDRAQTHESIRRNLIEEAYEAAEAIDLCDTDKLVEETGDVMLQTVLHAQIGKDMGEYDITDVVTRLCEKMIERHTHIFGGDSASDNVEALDLWEKNKQKLKGQKRATQGLFDVPKTFPALMYSEKVSKRASKANFDFERVEQIFDKVNEEFSELKEAIEKNTNIFEEVGDLLFAVSNLARFLKVDGELALIKTSEKFIGRFDEMEREFERLGEKMESATRDRVEEIYRIAKENLKNKRK